MMRSLLLVAMLALAAVGMADRRPFRIPIRHADPWTVKMLIEGRALMFPENSTMPGFAASVGNAAAASSKLLENGFLVVNPTDNSLWFYPDKEKQ